MSTIDTRAESGEDIPIEERTAQEVTHVQTTRVVPEGVPVFNYAFDITPHRLITHIITETGVMSPPFDQDIARAVQGG
jgi:methylthioribose-1-phosphate isomerase